MLWFYLDYVTFHWEMHILSYWKFSSLTNSFYSAPEHTREMAAEPLDLLWIRCAKRQSPPLFQQADFTALRWMTLQFEYIKLHVVDVPSLPPDFLYWCPFLLYLPPHSSAAVYFFLRWLISAFPSLVSRVDIPGKYICSDVRNYLQLQLGIYHFFSL